MLFDQKIKYLNYMEAGVRLHGAGFLRLECWGKVCNLVIQVSGLTKEWNGEYAVFAQGGGREGEIQKVYVEQGKGRLEIRGMDCANLADSGISTTELERIVIPLGSRGMLVGVLREMQETGTLAHGGQEQRKLEQESPKMERLEKESPEMARLELESPEMERLEKESPEVASPELESPEMARPEQESPEMARLEQESPEMARPEQESPEMVRLEQKSPETKKTEQDSLVQSALESGQMEENDGEGGAEPYAMQMTLKPGKWEQLNAIYPPIAPFGDNRRFLQISPGDFVILKDRSYRMVNNSFLLHGYFAYKHLILHRMRRKGETVYYVGVPGNYYDKEKEVAILFGFESFEGATEPAREGDYGYYMMRVEI